MKRNDLRFFNHYLRLDIHGIGHLPHWQQVNATYFVTFRLGDSLPSHLTVSWKEERHTWLTLHPEPWSEADEKEYHERFTQKLEQWLDAGHGSCLLASPESRACVVATLRHRDGVDYHLHAWVIMPNHVHVLVSLNSGVPLEKTLSSWKGVSAKRINGDLDRTGPLWQANNFDRLIRDETHFARCVRYIRRNPEKAHLLPEQHELFESPLAKQFAP